MCPPSTESKQMVFGINALSVKPGLTGGGETYLRELVAQLFLEDRENQYCLFVSEDNRACFPLDEPNVRVMVSSVAQRSTGYRVAAEQTWLPFAARRAGVDVLLCPTDSVPLLRFQRTVMTVQNLLPFHPEFWDANGRLGWKKAAKHRCRRFLVRSSARRASALLAVSEQTRREAGCFCGVDPSRIIVAHHGVSPRFRRAGSTWVCSELLSRYRLNRPFLLIVGALSPYKNLDCAIRALAHLRQRSRQVPMLVLVGDDRIQYRARLESLATELGVRDCVRFMGVVPHCDLPILYSGAVASMSLSSCESFGLPVVEAMACGCPVVCANRSSLPEVAGSAALIVAPQCVEAVAEAAWLLLSRPDVWDAYSKLGLERARQFDWRTTARITRDVLLAVAEGRPPANATACSATAIDRIAVT
jgi:glycosyltransferase involved in cell wall biosynthesis